MLLKVGKTYRMKSTGSRVTLLDFEYVGGKAVRALVANKYGVLHVDLDALRHKKEKVK